MLATYIVIGVIAYAIGSISFSVIFSRKFAGFDVREKGSGNAGTTNVLRTVGKKVAALTLLCDILKGTLSVLIAMLIGNIFKIENKAILVQIAAIFVIIGHTFPVYFGFKGGKGVATSLGVVLLINWQIGLICLVFALLLMVSTKIVSVGSCSVALLYPVLTLFIHENYLVKEGSGYFIYSVIMGLIVLYNHRSNIKRILNGTENKLSFGKK